MAGSFMHEMLGCELGFLEKSEKWRLKSCQFPSKVGGKPAWLDLRDLPATEELLCSGCRKPLWFLAQVYAPEDDEECSDEVKENCYHRTVFIFLCTEPGCSVKNSNGNFAVFRCQLPRDNEFYPAVDPPEDPAWKADLDASKYTTLCIVCGCSGKKRCGGCQKMYYCTKEHQVLHWKNGHKIICKEMVEVKGADDLFTLPEYEMIIEDEKLEVQLSKEKKLEKEMEEFEKILASKNPAFQNDETVDSALTTMAAEVSEDKQFTKFKDKTQSYPDQVLRYNKGGDPLWVSESNKPLTVPCCEFCESERRFEFQVGTA